MTGFHRKGNKHRIRCGECEGYSPHGVSRNCIAYRNRQVMVKFVGTHAEYDRIDPNAV